MKKTSEENKKKVLAVYIVQCVSLVLPVVIFAVFFMHWQSKKVLKDTWLESHGNWQIKTAIIYLILMLSLIVVMLFSYGAEHTSIKDLTILIGAFIFVGVLNVWVLYRMFIGLLRLGESNPIIKSS